MALINTGKAIGKITALLCEQLNAKTGLTVIAGRPEPQKDDAAGDRLNIFLYEASFDPSLKNTPLADGHPAPLWLVLKYLLTAFDEDGESDSIQAHERLGQGLRALQEIAFLRLDDIVFVDPEIPGALQDNPEILKITFDDASSELLARVMQGSEEKYRFSMAFQVRPIMIAPGELPSYSLLVGVDYTPTPDKIIGDQGVQIAVLPSLGPQIAAVLPAKFEVGDNLTITGSDLHLSDLSVRLASATLDVVEQTPTKLKCAVGGAVAAGGTVSAGSQPLAVIQNLPSGRQRSSNILVAELLPALANAARVDTVDPFVYLDLFGALLGAESDDIFVALYQDGKVIRLYDEFEPIVPAPAPQTRLRVRINNGTVPVGKYLVILKVNGQQAKNSPEVEFIL